jgi:hypothetical protein
MNHQSITLDLPDEVYERVRQAAEDSQRPVESVLLDTIALLFGGKTIDAITPGNLDSLSDDQLWAVVHRPLAWPQDARLRELTALGKSGALSDDEQAEMDTLLDVVDRYVLVRSQALLLLKQRGYDVERRLKSGA